MQNKSCEILAEFHQNEFWLIILVYARQHTYIDIYPP